MEDNEEHAAKIIYKIYGKFENLQIFLEIVSGHFENLCLITPTGAADSVNRSLIIRYP